MGKFNFGSMRGGLPQPDAWLKLLISDSSGWFLRTVKKFQKNGHEIKD